MNEPASPSALIASDIQRAGQILFAAMRENTRIVALPDATPSTLEEAYAVQSVIASAAGPVGGWKVSPLREEGEPRCSPIPSVFFGNTPVTFDPNVLATFQAELEVGIRLGSDLISKGGLPGTDEVAAAIAAVHPVVELLYSRFAADSAAPDFHRLADLQNCAGVVVGQGITDWRQLEFADLALELALDGDVHRVAQPQPSTEQTLAAIAWLAGHAHRRGLPLKAGDIIITGARIGPFALTSAKAVAGRAGALGDITLSRR